MSLSYLHLEGTHDLSIERNQGVVNERNFVDGKNGSKKDPYQMQKVRTSLIPRKAQRVL